ncbi:MAG TPA: TetR/AcrR family transcriptional regulator [Clostridiales bacterium]|nr:TetR/AcrR family transcriptional regulator [Clostridiales bacterium]HQP69197.1 TetR/AcrR family transcriptional regulator [Clostridiales bacterium]
MAELTERQKEIIEKAIKIIANDGIQNLTIKNLSKAIGVTEAALYRHYESKHSIMIAILDLFEEFSRTAKTGSGLKGIESFLMERYDKFIKNPELTKVMFSEAIFINDKELSKRMRLIIHGHRKELELLIDEAKSDNDISNSIETISLFRMIIGSMRLLVIQWCFNNYEFDLKKEGKILWNNINNLIKTR